MAFSLLLSSLLLRYLVSVIVAVRIRHYQEPRRTPPVCSQISEEPIPAVHRASIYQIAGGIDRRRERHPFFCMAPSEISMSASTRPFFLRCWTGRTKPIPGRRWGEPNSHSNPASGPTMSSTRSGRSESRNPLRADGAKHPPAPFPMRPPRPAPPWRADRRVGPEIRHHRPNIFAGIGRPLTYLIPHNARRHGNGNPPRKPRAV